MIIALDIVLLHNDSRGFQILQALQGVTTLRQVLLGIQKQSTAEYPYFSYWLSSDFTSLARSYNLTSGIIGYSKAINR